MLTILDIYNNEGHNLLHSEITSKPIENKWDYVEGFTDLSGQSFVVPVQLDVVVHYWNHEGIYQVRIETWDEGEDTIPVTYVGFARVGVKTLGDDDTSSLMVSFTHPPLISA